MRLILSALITIIFWIGVTAQTPVPPGPISGTWTPDGNPYLIEGVNTIEDGTTLTIEPGVIVKWQNDSCPMWVYGQILAQGTVTDSIIFTAADPSTGWDGMRFDSTLVTNDTSKFEYCVFEYAKAYGPYPYNCGGAIIARNFGKIIFDHCYFHDNEAMDFSSLGNGSGAIALWTSSPRITNCKFENNSGLLGGAIICYMYSHPLIEDNVFNKNSGHDYLLQYGVGYGGAIVCANYSDPDIVNNTFNKNHADFGGGAIFIIWDCNPVIDHNLIYNNTAEGGGAISVQDTSSTGCHPSIINNTIVDNNAVDGNGGGINIWGSCTPEIKNTILWGNEATSTGNQVYLAESTFGAEFRYCDIENGQIGFGGNPPAVYDSCINADPLFEDPLMGNYHLSPGSPCIDKGDPTMFDPDGTRCDIGAFYYDQGTGYPEPGIQYPISRVECYPNPASGKLDIRYSISDPSTSSGQVIRNVQIDIHDLTGKLIMSFEQFSQKTGEQTVSINVSELPDGVYFIRLSGGNEYVVKKLIVRH